MTILSKRVLSNIRAAYRQRYAPRPLLIGVDGRLRDGGGSCAVWSLPVMRNALAHALAEAVRWGEPYVFMLAPGVIGWMVPLMDGSRLKGGLCCGVAIGSDDAAQREEAMAYLVGSGAGRDAAGQFLEQLPRRQEASTREAADYLFEISYQFSGLDAGHLRRNRENALQQRQIAEAIQDRKVTEDRSYPLHEEQMLLSLIRVGDRNGARRVLNNMLASMFLRSPRFPLLQARCIEMMGYLVRVAIEDSPVQQSLMERHQDWIEYIVRAADFESLSIALRNALDDFMHNVSLQGYNKTSTQVEGILNYLAAHYRERLTLDQVAAAVGLSRYTVAHMVKRHTGRTVIQHVRGLRIQKARELLTTTDRSYADIAYDLGFTDQSYFTRQFREMTGTTPAAYRQAERSRRPALQSAV